MSDHPSYPCCDFLVRSSLDRSTVGTGTSWQPSGG
jgi:hypothetical protein